MSDLGHRQLKDRRRKPGRRRFGGCLAVLVALAIIVGHRRVRLRQGRGRDQGLAAQHQRAGLPGQGHGSVVVQVKSGDTASDIGATLEQADVVKSAEAFTDAAKSDSRSCRIQVGYYRMRLQMSGRRRAQADADPDARGQPPASPIPEGLRAKEILATIAAHTQVQRRRVKAAFDDTKALGLPSYANGRRGGLPLPGDLPRDTGQQAAGAADRHDQAVRAGGDRAQAHASAPRRCTRARRTS